MFGGDDGFSVVIVVLVGERALEAIQSRPRWPPNFRTSRGLVRVANPNRRRAAVIFAEPQIRLDCRLAEGCVTPS